MKDFSFQGKVFLGERRSDGRAGALKWVGDAPTCTVTLATESETRRESYSGNRLTSARLQTSRDATIALTLNWASAENLALGLYGNVVTTAAGTVTGEALPADLVAGDYVVLERGGISGLQIEDGAGTPVDLVLDTNYKIDSLKGGVVEILDPAALVQPFVASYSHGASVDVAMFSAQAPERYLLLDGVNTLDGSRVKLRLYRTQFDPMSSLPLINESFGQIELSGAVLYDDDAASDVLLGGFGKIEVTDAA